MPDTSPDLLPDFRSNSAIVRTSHQTWRERAYGVRHLREHPRFERELIRNACARISPLRAGSGSADRVATQTLLRLPRCGPKAALGAEPFPLLPRMAHWLLTCPRALN